MPTNPRRYPSSLTLLASVLATLLLCLSPASAQPFPPRTDSPQQQAVWKLEQAYWQFVKANDLAAYLTLWHPDFLGWPDSSATPARRDHITKWITSHTAKGEHLQSYTLKPAASHAVGNLVFTYYWITALWLDKQGHGQPGTFRLMHVWIRTAAGWRIIAGMSAPEKNPLPR